MSAVRYYTDEDLHGHLAVLLRAAGIDAVSTPEAHRLGENDTSQLACACQEKRVLVSFNVHTSRDCTMNGWLRVTTMPGLLSLNNAPSATFFDGYSILHER